MYDVIIIGAGVTGAAIARELSRYKVDACVLEKDEDVCCGTSKANSAIIHAGFDAAHGTLMAKMNVAGNLMMDQLVKTWTFRSKNGSLVVCLSEDDRPKLEELYERGIANGVKELKLLTKDEVLEMEPNLSESIVGAYMHLRPESYVRLILLLPWLKTLIRMEYSFLLTQRLQI